MGPVNRHTFFTVSVIRTGFLAGAVVFILILISEFCNEFFLQTGAFFPVSFMHSIVICTELLYLGVFNVSITYTIIMSGIFPVLSVGMLLLILLLFRLIGHGAYCGTGRGNS